MQSKRTYAWEVSSCLTVFTAWTVITNTQQAKYTHKGTQAQRERNSTQQQFYHAEFDCLSAMHQHQCRNWHLRVPVALMLGGLPSCGGGTGAVKRDLNEDSTHSICNQGDGGFGLATLCLIIGWQCRGHIVGWRLGEWPIFFVVIEG